MMADSPVSALSRRCHTRVTNRSEEERREERVDSTVILPFCDARLATVRISQSLEARVSNLNFSGLRSTAVTSLVTREVCECLETIGLRTEREHQVVCRPDRTGFVDVVAYAPCGRLVVAVEIDRGNKRLSLEKLSHLRATRGAAGVWVRWGREHRLQHLGGYATSLGIASVCLPLQVQTAKGGRRVWSTLPRP